MYDLGDTVPLTVTIRDTAGVAVNPTTITLAITLPDGTTDTPVIANPPAVTGIFPHSYVTLQAGLHRYRYASTVPSTAFEDVFNVWPLAGVAMVGLAETKRHLNIDATDTTYDDELRGTIREASAVVEGIVGACASRTVAETFSGRGGDKVYTSLAPILSITSIVEDGTTVAASGYSFNANTGVITRTGGTFAVGDNNIVLTYVPGRRIIPDNILGGCKDLIRANFRPQIGGNYSPFDTPGATPTEGTMRLGFFVPNSVMERLKPSEQGPFYL